MADVFYGADAIQAAIWAGKRVVLSIDDKHYEITKVYGNANFAVNVLPTSVDAGSAQNRFGIEASGAG